jgi:hypothetical protein
MKNTYFVDEIVINIWVMIIYFNYGLCLVFSAELLEVVSKIIKPLYIINGLLASVKQIDVLLKVMMDGTSAAAAASVPDFDASIKQFKFFIDADRRAEAFVCLVPRRIEASLIKQ